MRMKTLSAGESLAADQTGDAVIRQALRELEARARRPGALLNSHSVASDWFRLKIGGYEHEVFAAAWLDNRRCLIAFEELFRGSLDRTAVYAREVVKAALRHNAAAVLFAHNHPSGSVLASGDDLALTLELSRALDLVDVRVLDHIVVSASEASQSVWSAMASPLRGRRKAKASRAPRKPRPQPEATPGSTAHRAAEPREPMP